ncbi:MAG: dynamin family protein [Deltaproteobacteria bacterium]|nr:dynamin family protein [Deltaproteobacteria bacterium]MBW1956413.1 dynamin family protein [Deltaproteobacteria bacterium]MBW2041693.1 dynamin family protein [Deltaproteobacteria bacterium]MBW2131755.1 dynamin family protein [Deltaproteobacteria bacterium]
MRPDHTEMRNALSQIDESLVRLLERLKTIPHVDADAFADWEATCATVQKQLSEEIVRVAVVGAIKSGKSTLVNALFKGDYLKRGAGVVTSIVTRIRSGKDLRARLFFKTWEEVNENVKQSLILFPHPVRFSDREGFDIREKEIRNELKKALDSLDGEHLVTTDTRSIHSVVLGSYLRGYERVYEKVSSPSTVWEFTEPDFGEHRRFVGDESLAVYLKDVSLEIPTDRFSPHMEIADCQGSDAPNPLHLAMIQDYLASTHLIVYVISSRTGIRQADIKFLSMIKKMGILDNTLFVVNCDLSEHDSLVNLMEVVDKIQKDVAVMQPDPRLFVFSALFNLFSANPDDLSEKDRFRMLQWEKETELVAFCNDQAHAFESALFGLIHGERSRLLLKNHVERLWMVSSGIFRWIRIMEKGLTQSTSDVGDLIAKLKAHQERTEQIRSVIQTTLDGSVLKMKGELKSDIDRFFDVRPPGIGNRILRFIREWAPPYERYEGLVEKNGFSQAMYQLFSDFKENLDTFIAEAVNPEVIRFVKDAETKMARYLAGMAAPFEAMVRDALEDYNRNMDALDIPSSVEPSAGSVKMDMDWIRQGAGIRLPQNDMALRYSAKIRSDALLHFGFFSFTGWIAKLLKRPVSETQREGIRSLRKGVSRMKSETEKTVLLHFKDYRENIKFQYIFKISEAASRYLMDTLFQRLQDYASTLTLLGRIVEGQRRERAQTLETIQSSKAFVLEIRDRMLRIREGIDGSPP